MRIFTRNQPLWLPRGSVRSLLALAVVGGGVYAAFVSADAADRLLPLAGAALAYYFRERAGEGGDNDAPGA